MNECLFCKMVTREITPEIVYENDDVLAFKDINPQAPVHVLIVPKRHVSTINDIEPADAELIGRLFLAAKEVALQEGVGERGYRTLMNCNADGGQLVFHVHLHLLAGRRMGWPPG